MKILLFGAKGYLGHLFLEQYPDAVSSSVDIADSQAVAKELDRVKPDVVINAAGKTGRPNVDWCETHKEEALRSNVTGPLVLLDECAMRKIYWVHLGSGCIYAGDGSTSLTTGNNGKGFSEEDAPNFGGSFYARTKLWSDQILKEFPDVLILRIRMPFDGTRNERSLITKLTNYAKVIDVQNSLTYLPDLIQAADQLIQQRKTGIYNMVNPGSLSAFEIMEMYKEIVDPSHTFQKISLDELMTMVQAGRSNCILSGKKLEKEGIVMKPVKEAVREAMEKLKQ